MLTQEFVVWMGRRVQASAEFEQDEVLPTRYVHDTLAERKGPEPKSI